jgi:hypothetical protein
MSVFGSQDDDPLFENDPLAPSSNEKNDETTPDAPSETSATGRKTAASNGAPRPEDSVFERAAPEEGGAEEEFRSRSESEDVSRADLLALLVENRAAIDVLFEMMAYARADGREEGYRRFLEAMRARHQQAAQEYRAALDADLCAFDLDVDSASTPDAEKPGTG